MAIRPKHLPTIEDSGYYVAPLPTLNTWLINAVQTIANGARQHVNITAFHNDISPQEEATSIANMLSAGRSDPWVWHVSLKDGGMKDISVATGVLSSFQAIFGGLTTDKKPVLDYGKRLNEVLLATSSVAGGLGSEAFSAPALGYARSQAATGHAVPKGAATFLAPSPSSRWGRWVAGLAFELDRPFMGLKMVPYVHEILHISVRDLWGNAKLNNDRLRKLMAWMMLYNFQGPRLWFGAHEYYNRTSLDLYAAHDPDSHEIVNQATLAYEHIMKLPIAPLAQAIAQATKTCTVKGTRGTLPGLFRFVLPSTEPVEAKSDKPSGKRPAHKYYDDLVADARVALSDASRILVDMPEDERRKYRHWTACSAPNDRNELVDIMTLQARVESVSNFVDEWSAIASELGWDRKVSMSIGEIDITGPQFIVTDGHTYSSEPTKGLLGLTPVLSLGNVRAGGFEPAREADDFNPNSESFAFSVMVVKGHLAASVAESEYSRVAVPGSMWMGEDGARRLTPNAMNRRGPIAIAVIGHYESKSPSGYLEDNYPPQIAGFVWDAQFTKVGGTPAAVQAEMLKRYKAAKDTCVAPANQVPYYTFTNKEITNVFYHRFPVIRSLPVSKPTQSPWLFYDQHGLRSPNTLAAYSVVDLTYEPYEVGVPGTVLEELVALAAPNMAPSPVIRQET